MDHFVARQNIRNFRRELENGTEEPRRATLLQLLDEQFYHLDPTDELLRSLDRHIERLRKIMAHHAKFIDTLHSLGEPTERPQAVLATLNDLVATYVAHSERVRTALA